MIKADRTRSWLMHLQVVSNCLTVFAAAGHFNYLRSAHYYLKKMSNLEEKHPDVYRTFLGGFHVVRRSNLCWAGLSSDRVIEQTLMRSVSKEHRWSNSWQRGDRRHGKPLDLICTCNIRVQHCDAGFHKPNICYKSTTQRLN